MWLMPLAAQEGVTHADAPGAPLSPAQANDPLWQAASAYIASPGQQQLIDHLLSPQAITAQIRAASPDLPVLLVTTVSRIAAQELDDLRPKLEEAMIRSAASTFTAAEIDALHAFYDTPEGRAILLKMQPFLEQALDMVAPDIRAAQDRILQQTLDQLRLTR